MTITRKFIVVSCAVLAVSLTGCWDDDDDDVAPPAVVTEVPASAGVSAAAFISYLLTLGANDESSEPATLTAAFAVPADDGSEPAVLP